MSSQVGNALLAGLRVLVGPKPNAATAERGATLGLGRLRPADATVFSPTAGGVRCSTEIAGTAGLLFCSYSWSSVKVLLAAICGRLKPGGSISYSSAAGGSMRKCAMSSTALTRSSALSKSQVARAVALPDFQEARMRQVPFSRR